MIASFVLAALFSKTVQQADVLQPPPVPPMTFAQTAIAMHAQPVTYKSSDGVPLRGFWIRAANAGAPFVLFFYGNGDLAPYENDRLAWLQELGYNAVCFDYRGYGYSGGKPDARAMRNDSVALYDFVVRDLENAHAPAFVYGWSLGTQMAIHVAAQRRVRGLVLQAPVASAQEEVDWIGARQLRGMNRVVRLIPSADVRTLLEGAREITPVRAPLMVIHGTNDTLIPIAQGHEVFAAAASADKRFVQVPGAGHDDLRFADAPAGPALAQFLRTH
jgi:uncharacterized protein